jgi:purine-nucleoside/S-methyl-5'-thioadenosine phosphorylase / adenosine deaminase
MEWRNEGGVEWLEAALPGVRVAFSTRIGGVSEGPYGSLNLGYLTGDDRSRVVENRRRLAAALGLDPQSVLIGRQVHEAELDVHLEPQRPSPFDSPGAPVAEVDGQVAIDAGLAPLVFTADCLPVALAGPGGVAMLHCGWRGLAAGIIPRGVEAIAATDAAIGPGIGPCCYEVGEDVLAAFAAIGIDARGPTLDLADAARRMLSAAGVDRIEAAANLCTRCEEERFFSHRRDAGTTGRQAGLAWIEEG